MPRSPATSRATQFRTAPGAPPGAPETGFRTWGKSKDYRDDLPQVVIGMAVTRNGLPLRVWCWPGNTADPALIRQVKDEVRDWSLSRVVWVADRGFTSAENRRYLRKGGNHYITGERLRSGSAEAGAALSRQGRYQEVAGNLRVKEARIAADERFVICPNPEGSERDAAIRARVTAQLHAPADCAASSTASPAAPSHAPPAPSASAPRSPLPRPPSSNSSASTSPRGSTSSPRPQPADQRKQAA